MCFYVVQTKLGDKGIINKLTVLAWLKCGILQTSSRVTVKAVNKV